MAKEADERELWCVDVVLRALGRERDEDRVVALVAEEIGDVDPAHRVRPTGSYDMPPPDGSIGVSCWIPASSAGEAADTALRIVSAAARAVTGQDHPLWDLRLLPASAVITRSEERRGSPLRRRRYTMTLWRRRKSSA